MAQIICHDNGRYNFYCTISDGFRFVESISFEQLVELIKDEGGSHALSDLDDRLDRAHQFGHSARGGESLDDFLCCNRAGENEAKLSTEQCIKQFLG